MSHKMKVGQSVVSTHQRQERPDVYEVVRLMPETVSGEPQYQIKGKSNGIQRVVREAEIKAAFSSAGL
jgi:hypothetical protein